MSEKKMAQKATAARVVGNGNWEKYMWPHQIDKTAKPANEKKTKRSATHQTINASINTVGQGSTQFFNAVGSSMSGVTFNDYRK